MTKIRADSHPPSFFGAHWVPCVRAWRAAKGWRACASLCLRRERWQNVRDATGECARRCAYDVSAGGACATGGRRASYGRVRRSVAGVCALPRGSARVRRQPTQCTYGSRTHRRTPLIDHWLSSHCCTILSCAPRGARPTFRCAPSCSIAFFTVSRTGFPSMANWFFSSCMSRRRYKLHRLALLVDGHRRPLDLDVLLDPRVVRRSRPLAFSKNPFQHPPPTPHPDVGPRSWRGPSARTVSA